MKHFYFSWAQQSNPLHFEVDSARCDEFLLKDGRRIYDFISTSFQANFGHSNELIMQRIQQQLTAMPIASPKSSFELKESVSRRLNDLVGLGPGKIFYTVGGAESVENALKIARHISGRSVVLARQQSYHGATLGALSVTGDWRNQAHLTFDAGTARIPEHDADPELEQTEQIIREIGPDNIAAVILETISGTNGMSMPPSEWFEGIQQLCRQHGILLVLDEVLVGFRRCGYNFAFQRHPNLNPDIVCMSKAITGGYIPFGAVWTTQKIASFYDHQTLACGLTSYAHPLGLAALQAVLDQISDVGFIRQMDQLELVFKEQLENWRRRPTIREIRIAGLMAAIYLDRPAPTWQQGFDLGLHLFCKDNLLILAPPYISDPDRLKQALNSLQKLLD